MEQIKERTTLKIIKLNPKEKTKMRKSDIIIMGISKWDALAPTWQEKYFETFNYSMPYKALRSWYEKLFSNNPELQYNKPGEERELGSVILKEDKKGINRPKFAFIVNRNLSDDIINLETAPKEQREELHRAYYLDKEEQNRERYFAKGIEYIKENLLRECPITYRLLVPLELLKDFPKTLWKRVIRSLEELNEYFVNTEVTLFVTEEEKERNTTETGGEKLEDQGQTEINNIKGKKSFPVIRIEGHISGWAMKALADTGAAVSVINDEDAKKAKLEIKESNVKLRTANNSPLKNKGCTRVPFKLKTGEILDIEAECVQDKALKGKMIIGLDFLKKHKAQIDCGTLNIFLPEQNIHIKGTEQHDAVIKIIKQGEERNKYKIKLKNNEVIEAETTKIVEVRTKKGRLEGRYVFVPNKQWDAYTTSVIVEFSKENTAHIPITNGNKHPLNINKLHILGKLEEIDENLYEIKPTMDNIVWLQYASIESERRQNEEIYKQEENQVSMIEGKEEEGEINESIRMITSVTEPGSTERIFLLTKLYEQNKIPEEKNKGLQGTINKVNCQMLSKEDFEDHLEEIDVKDISEEERKSYVQQIIGRHIEDREKRDKIGPILEKHYQCIAINGIDLGHFEIFKMSIDYFGPILNTPQKPVPIKYQEALDTEINRLLKAGVIEESNSFFNSNIILVPKKESKTLRLVLDSRAINVGTRREITIMPRVNEMLFSMGGSELYTTIDLLSAYWSVGLDEKSTHLTAFSTHTGHYHFKKCVMGLSNSANNFLKVMRVVLDGLIYLGKDEEGKILCYMDDLILLAKSEETNIDLLDKALERFVRFKLKIKLTKCKFLEKEIEFLGHKINKSTISPICNNITKINNFPIPNTKKKLQSFLGMVNYYRSYIKDMAELANPMYALLKKEFEWNKEAEEAFYKIKEKLTGGLHLFHPDLSRPFILTTDSSKHSIAGVLSQVDSRGIDKPLLFISRTLQKAERIYPIAHQELLSIAFCLDTLRNLILGSKIFVVMDHYNLLRIFSSALQSPRMVRISIKISEFTPDLYFKCGTENVAADFLSRIFENNESDILYINTVNEVKFPLENLPEELHKDPYCQEILRKMKEKDEIKIKNKKFEKISNLLYLQNESNQEKRLVLPRKYNTTIIKIVHEDSASAHPGMTQTINKIQNHYYWKNMTVDIKNYIKKCMKCNTLKATKIKGTTLVIYSESTQPFSSVVQDLVGPLNMEDGTQKYILTVICRLTRFVEATILRDKSAESVAYGLLEALFARHGFPNVLLSDNGREFDNEVMRTLEQKFSIKRVFTAAYNPQSSGLIEAFNKTLGKNLRLLSNKYNDWHLWVTMATHAYNTAIHSTTGKTPFFNLYFRDAATTYQALSLMGKQIKEGEKTIPYHMMARTRAIFLDCADTIQASDRKRNRKINKEVKEDIFKPGDLVFVKHIPKPGINEKLQPKYTGPYRLIEHVSQNIYIVESLTTGKTYKTHMRRAVLAHAEVLPEGAHPNLNKCFPEFLEIMMEDQGLEEVTREKAISDWVINKEENDLENLITEKPEPTIIELDITHSIWDDNRKLNLCIVDALETTPRVFLKKLYDKYDYLNIHLSRKKLENTNLASIKKDPEMGRIYEKITDTRNRKNKWILIQAKLLHKADRVQELLCSTNIPNYYKQLLLTSTAQNRLYWTLKGLRNIPKYYKNDIDFVILHIPNNYPLTFLDKNRIIENLKRKAQELEANPIINFHED